MPAELLMVSRFPAKTDMAEDLAAVLDDIVEGRVFVGIEADEVLTLEPIEPDLDLAGLRSRFADIATDHAQYLSGDTAPVPDARARSKAAVSSTRSE